jgi:hypothetical protein
LKSVRNGRQERSTSAWRAKRPERIYRKNVALPRKSWSGTRMNFIL